MIRGEMAGLQGDSPMLLSIVHYFTFTVPLLPLLQRNYSNVKADGELEGHDDNSNEI